MNAVTENRHVGKAGIRYDEEFVHRPGKAVEHDLGLECFGIKKQDFWPISSTAIMPCESWSLMIVSSLARQSIN